tara:strand:- start:478 stop:1020 length:543 start_codon:yes stop_codon:yes gene_type:complete
MKNVLATIISIIGILLTGCSSIGPEGSSHIVFAEDGMGDFYALLTGMTYSYDVDIEGYTWDGEYDVNLYTNADYDCINELPKHSISPGTYDYTVTIIASDNGNISGTASSDTLIYCTTTSSSCPSGGVPVNTALLVAPNLAGADAASLFEDGAAGEEMYYLFYVSYSGLVTWAGGVADCD